MYGYAYVHLDVSFAMDIRYYIFFYLSILLAVRLPTYSDIQDISLLNGSEFQSELVYGQLSNSMEKMEK